MQPLSFADQLWVTGVARNVGPHLDAVLGNFERLAQIYPDIHFSLFENDSDDDTRARLQSWVAGVANAVNSVLDLLCQVVFSCKVCVGPPGNPALQACARVVV